MLEYKNDTKIQRWAYFPSTNLRSDSDTSCSHDCSTQLVNSYLGRQHTIKGASGDQASFLLLLLLLLLKFRRGAQFSGEEGPPVNTLINLEDRPIKA